MTAPVAAITVAEADASLIGSVMTVMETAFEARFGEAWAREQCLSIMGLPGVWLTVARSGDMITGFTLSRVIVDEAELLLIAVLPEIQGKGIGALLLEDMVKRATNRGATRLHLEVREGNPAFGLYRRFGFIPVGRRKAYYHGEFGQSFDALTLTLAL
jgi:ribosomal-protein-alanine N-acetyltransferase